MANSGYLYRRLSGIYVVRICVPKRLQSVIGRGEIHVSTGVRDPVKAKAAAFRLLSHWQQRVLELDGMNVLKVIEGSPLLGGEGLIRLIDLAQEFEIDPKPLLMEAVNIHVSLHCVADNWRGIEVADISEVERDFDESFVLNSVLEIGQSKNISSQLVMFDSSMAAKQFIESGEYLGEIFYLDLKRRRAVFFNPGEKVRIDGLLLSKADAERIRVSLSIGVTPEMLEAAKAFRLPSMPVAVTTSPIPALGHKYGSMHASELVEIFLTAKQGDWKEDHRKRMPSMCGAFVELMGDPILADIDRPMINEYRKKLQTLPHKPNQARHRYGVTTFADLIEAVGLAGDARMPLESANLYIRRLSEMMNWAVTEELMSRNPADGVGKSGKKNKMDQDERGIFDAVELDKIFGALWFQNGQGMQSRRGDYRYFQPHYYWLPLLGLYTGGRLNELSQLYLSDVRQDESGCWYLDFNMDGSDKLDADPKEEAVIYGDKSLKTVNSQRVVALHDHLVLLGLPEYVHALRDAGHVRLFPELRLDKIKGYGKQAGAWFNERFLGIQLKIPRDGTKTFHSLRHMFITGLFDAEVPEVTVAQLAGHVRGETMAGTRYRKDQDASKLQPYIKRLSFSLPTVKSFDIAAGLSAVESALDRKRRHPSSIV